MYTLHACTIVGKEVTELSLLLDQDPATDRLGAMEVAWVDKADSLLETVVIVPCLVEVDGEEELAGIGGGAEERYGVFVLVYEDGEVDASLSETIALEVVHVVIVVVSGIDELIGFLMVHLKAVDKLAVCMP